MPRVLARGSVKEAAERIRKQQLYRSDPVAWMEKELGRTMWSKTKEIARSVAANKHTAVQACHGVGKSKTAADLAAWWIAVHPVGTATVVTTAPTNHQVRNILWKEIGRAHGEAELPGYVTQDAQWKIKVAGNVEAVAFGRKPADHDADGFQGIHEEYVLVIIDEACGVPKQLWDAIDSIVTNDESRVLAIGNPDNPSTEFRENCKPGSGWNTIKISVFDWFKERAKFPSLQKHLTSPTWAKERAKRWGKKSPLYQSKVLGEFPDISDDMLIQPGMIQTGWVTDLAGIDKGNYGLDVSRYGEDKTVCYRHRAGVLRHEWSMHKSSTTVTSGRAIAQLREHVGAVPIVIDGVGLGGGVVDNVVAAGYAVFDYNSNHAPIDSARFANRRAEDYWTFREMLENGEIDLDPLDLDLANQLQLIKWSITPKGKIIIESKEDMAKRGVKSPDRADAAVMAALGATARDTTVVIPLGASHTQDLLDRPT